MFSEERIEKEIKEVLESYLKERELFLVEVKVSATAKIGVFVDGMQNIMIAQCAEISRFLEKHLEDNHLVGEKYTLEVSSPGMGTPFRVPQQYIKSLGKEVEVLLSDGIKKEGILKDYDGNSIQLYQEKMLKKKVVEQIEEKILLENIKSIIRPIKF